MPKKDLLNLEEIEDEELDEENEELDEIIDGDNEILEQVDKDSLVENKYNERKVKYGTFSKKAKTQADLAGYEKYRNYDFMPSNGVTPFLDEIGLHNGLIYNECKISNFKKALSKAIEADFTTYKLRHYYNNDDEFVTSENKKVSTMPLQVFDKASIIDYAKRKQGAYFNLLTGNGNPGASNPSFVKLKSKGKEELAYDVNKLNKLANQQLSDEKLYKMVVNKIPSILFKKVVADQQYNVCVKTDDEGNVISSYNYFGTGSNGTQKAQHLVNTYKSLKDIHKARPLFFRFRHPFVYKFEHDKLIELKENILECAENQNIKEETEKLLDSKKKNFEKNMKAFKDALDKVCFPKMSKEEIEEVRFNETHDALERNARRELMARENENTLATSEKIEVKESLTVDLNEEIVTTTTPEKKQVTIDINDEKNTFDIEPSEKHVNFEGMTEKEW